MSELNTTNIALKEWQAVTDALSTGRQCVLLRKGDISEAGGEFRIEHESFVLFPTYLHQQLNLVKPADRAMLHPMSVEPARIRLTAFARVVDILELKSRAAVDAIDDEHIWPPSLIDMRFEYRPDRPLYLLIVRAYRLAESVEIDNTPEYVGCKSWVKLKETISLDQLIPAIDNDEFARRRQLVRSHLR